MTLLRLTAEEATSVDVDVETEDTATASAAAAAARSATHCWQLELKLLPPLPSPTRS